MIEIPLSAKIAPMNDKEFQDWLAYTDVKLMQRSSNVEVEAAFKSSEFINLWPYEQLMALLSENAGYVVPWDSMSLALYKFSPLEVGLNNIRHRIHYIRKKKPTYPAILHKPEVGFGVGINKFKLTAQELRILYPLWLNAGLSVSTFDLITSIGCLEDSRDSRSIVHTHMCNIKKKINRGDARIESGLRNYKLID